MNSSVRLTAFAVFLAAASVAAGQAFTGSTDSVQRFERQLEQIQRDLRVRIDESIPPDQRAVIDYGGYTTFSFVTIDDPAQETHILRQYDLVGYGRVNIDNVHEFFARVRTSYYDFNSGDAFSNHGDDWVEPTLDRGHYRFDLARALAASSDRGSDDIPYNVVVQAGRQLVTWGNGLTLSEELDGAVVALSYDDLTLELLAALTRPSIADFDSSRPGFLGDTHRGFYGALLSRQFGPHRPYAYALVQRDYNHQDTLVLGDNGELVTNFNYDSYYLGIGAEGALGDRLLYGVELVYEGGETLSNSFAGDDFSSPITPIEQTEDDIEAFAADARLDYLFNDPARSRVNAELLLATGDSDRLTTSNTFGGNQSGTDDHAFNAFGLINTGLAFAPDVSNLLMLRVGASTYPLYASAPFERLQVGTDLFAFNKLRSSGPIDEPTSDDRFLGFETDFYANWQLSSDIAVVLRYGVFFPGEAIETDNDARHLFYAGVTYAF